MLMNLLGTSIENILVENKKIVSLKSALMIRYQMTRPTVFVHERQVIHWDIKPDNVPLSIHSNFYLFYIADFRLTKNNIKDKKILLEDR